jgi:hypothetical protein
MSGESEELHISAIAVGTDALRSIRVERETRIGEAEIRTVVGVNPAAGESTRDVLEAVVAVLPPSKE